LLRPHFVRARNDTFVYVIARLPQGSRGNLIVVFLRDCFASLAMTRGKTMRDCFVVSLLAMTRGKDNERLLRPHFVRARNDTLGACFASLRFSMTQKYTVTHFSDRFIW
jgi:hypothetical protein